MYDGYIPMIHWNLLGKNMVWERNDYFAVILSMLWLGSQTTTTNYLSNI